MIAARAASALRASLRRPDSWLAVVLLLAALSTTIVTCTSLATPRGPAPEVQVLLDRNVSDVDLALDGSYAVEDAEGRRIAGGPRLQTGRMRALGNDRLELNGVELPASEVVLRPQRGGFVQYAGRSFAGDLRIKRGTSGRLEIENVVDIEEYVAGVLFSEMPPSFPEQALLAQAVAARTYARYRLDHGDPLLRATDADQVYGGAGPNHARARELVAATRGCVLVVGDEILPAYFSSTCGGATVDGALVFPGAPKAGLQGVRCDYCRDSPKYRWTRALPLAAFERRLGLASGPLRSITARRDPFGRSIAFDVGSDGGVRTIAATELRRTWNAAAASDGEKLPGSWVLSLELAPDSIRIEGAGFGHGVGMCQFGAAGLARAGKSWREIVGFYYRGARLERWW